MKMLFKQRMFSWLDAYDIYDENGRPIYHVKSEISWGHCLKVFDNNNQEVGMVKEELFHLLPHFTLYMNGRVAGELKKEWAFFSNNYTLEGPGWRVSGDILQWNYDIYDGRNLQVASVRKQLFNLTDTYEIEVERPENALLTLLFVLSIDAEKCTQNKSGNTLDVMSGFF